MVCYDRQRPFRLAAMAARRHDRTARSGHVSLEPASASARCTASKWRHPAHAHTTGPLPSGAFTVARRVVRGLRGIDRSTGRGRAAAGGRWWLVLYRCPLTNPAQPPGLALIYRSILDGAPDRLALVLKLCTTHAEQVGAIFRSAAALFAAG